MLASSAREPMDGEQAAARCVVWHPRTIVAPAELLGALGRRNMQVAVADHAFRALALICALARMPQPTNQARRLYAAAGENGVLVLLEPRRLGDLAEVVDLVSRYRPATALWVHELSDPRRLKAMSALEVIASYCPPIGGTPEDPAAADFDAPFSRRPVVLQAGAESSIETPRLRLQPVRETRVATAGIAGPVQPTAAGGSGVRSGVGGGLDDGLGRGRSNGLASGLAAHPGLGEGAENADANAGARGASVRRVIRPQLTEEEIAMLLTGPDLAGS